MNPFYSVRFRLFALCVSLLIVLGGANVFLGYIIKQREAQEAEQREQYHRLTAIHAAEQAIHNFRYQNAQANNALMVNNVSQQQHIAKFLAAASAEAEARLAEVERFDPDSANVIRQSLEAYPKHVRSGVKAVLAGEQSAADRSLAEANRHLRTIEEAFKAATTRETLRVDRILEREMQRASAGIRWSAFVIAASGGFGLLVSLLILRSIVGPLQKTVVAIRQVNSGETTVDLPPISEDEFGDMAVALRQFRDQAERLRRMAYNDPLTGLGNRARMDEALRAEIDVSRRGNESLAVLYVDLDNFSAVNDSLGHSAGDRYLCEAALRLQRFVPPETLVCRYSGDKFVVLLSQLTAQTLSEQIHAVTDVILRGMAEPYQLGGNLLPMSVSIGIAVYPSDGETGEMLISSADAAMYLAKRSGRNKAQYATPDLTQVARKQLATATEIRRGLEGGEFTPYYQPVVDVEQNRVVGAEALLRWQHPTRGLVAAGEFIPAAEASGLIQALGERCMLIASEQTARWVEAGRAIRVSVNLSPRQIEDGTVIAFLERLHKGNGNVPTLLDFEITETAMLERVEQTQETLQRIRGMGHRLSVDDFGTGYSSLVYLQRFPLDRIKVDRSFVARVETSREAQAIISATVALARSLNLEVIAEGVETEGQVGRLRELGCTLQQGFFFTRALPWSEFETWMDGCGRPQAFRGVPKTSAA
jgi:diguanylate cyclase (GGDEF)-like protein